MDNNENIVVELEHEKDSFDESLDKKNALNGHHSRHQHESSHHHSSHHHHHHHSHRHSSKSHHTKKEKYKKFFKRYKYRISNIVIAVLFICVLVVLGFSLDKQFFAEKTNGEDTEQGIGSSSSMQIEIPIFNEDVVIVGTAVTSFMESDSPDAIRIYKKLSGYGRLDTGLPVKIAFNVKNMPEGYTVRSSEVYVSEKSDMSSPQVFSLSGKESSVDVYNLKTNTQYYYRISFSLSNGSKTSVEGSFKTANTPRVLSVDGVYNMRDIGGWKTVDGFRVRQGLLYRSTELDGAVEKQYSITPNGVNTMLSVLGIKTELDLRSEFENPNGINPLGAAVKHNYYGAPMYSNAFTEDGKRAIRAVFADLANKNNYPILLHCTHGMDRTGTVCYLLEALLGVGEEDLMRDYQLSALHYGDLWALDQMNEFVGRLKSYEGYTIREKTESYLLSIGVTSAEISAIKEIFLEK